MQDLWYSLGRMPDRRAEVAGLSAHGGGPGRQQIGVPWLSDKRHHTRHQGIESGRW
jgi:hypothetical protein